MQGDSLSPYLFIICVEVLYRLLTKCQENGDIHGETIANNAPPISHLLFVDDIMLFCNANPKEGRNLMKVLDQYHAVFGQKINIHKSEMIFISNIYLETRRNFKNQVSFSVTNSIAKY
jgi:hypothetical protein